jgi:hypothetical protein
MARPRPFQRSGEEELQGGHALLDGFGSQLTILNQVELELPDVVDTELIGRLFEITGKLLHRADVGVYGTLSVIATLEFFQHHFA